MSESDLVWEVRAAAAGDADAWENLVSRFSGLVWAVVRAHGLKDCDAADAAQTTWLRLAEHVDRLREPERVAAWLATTARYESLRTLRRSARVVPAEFDLDSRPGCSPPVDHRLLADERNDGLWKAFETLPPPCQSLLRVLMADPAPSYDEVSAALGMPRGSIGPRRSRCLHRLRTELESAAGHDKTELYA